MAAGDFVSAGPSPPPPLTLDPAGFVAVPDTPSALACVPSISGVCSTCGAMRPFLLDSLLAALEEDGGNFAVLLLPPRDVNSLPLLLNTGGLSATDIAPRSLALFLGCVGIPTFSDNGGAAPGVPMVPLGDGVAYLSMPWPCSGSPTSQRGNKLETATTQRTMCINTHHHHQQHKPIIMVNATTATRTRMVEASPKQNQWAPAQTPQLTRTSQSSEYLGSLQTLESLILGASIPALSLACNLYQV